MSGAISGISPGPGSHEGSRCAIWNTVATDESDPWCPTGFLVYAARREDKSSGKSSLT